MEHLNDPNKFIKNIKNRLNKSGKIIIGTPIIETFLSNYFNKNYRLYNKSHKIIFNEKIFGPKYKWIAPERFSRKSFGPNYN